MLPRFAAVHCAKNAPLFVRRKRITQRGHVSHIGIGRVNFDVPDSIGHFEAHVFPGFARVGRFIDPVAIRNISPDFGLSHAHIQRVGVRRSHRYRPHRRRFKRAVGNRRPVGSPVDSFPDSPARRTKIIRQGLVGMPGSGQCPPCPEGADISPPQAVEQAVGYGVLYRWGCRSSRFFALCKRGIGHEQHGYSQKNKGTIFSHTMVWEMNER